MWWRAAGGHCAVWRMVAVKWRLTSCAVVVTCMLCCASCAAGRAWATLALCWRSGTLLLLLLLLLLLQVKV